MSIIRLIHITIDPSEVENAIRVWKAECAPLMIQQKGCRRFCFVERDEISAWHLQTSRGDGALKRPVIGCGD